MRMVIPGPIPPILHCRKGAEGLGKFFFFSLLTPRGGELVSQNGANLTRAPRNVTPMTPQTSTVVPLASVGFHVLLATSLSPEEVTCFDMHASMMKILREHSYVPFLLAITRGSQEKIS